jgi:hypothetical protein
VEKRSWSTSGFIGGHHRNFAGTLVCQLNVFWVPVVGGHQYAILKIEGTCASEKLWQNQRARSISGVSQNPRIPALSVAAFGHFHLQLRMHMIRSWPMCKVDESRNMIWSLRFNCVQDSYDLARWFKLRGSPQQRLYFAIKLHLPISVSSTHCAPESSVSPSMEHLMNTLIRQNERLVITFKSLQQHSQSLTCSWSRRRPFSS